MHASIGIDLGTDRTRIYTGHSIVLDEPSVIAVKARTWEVLKYGEDAYKMMGKTSDNVMTVCPIERGIIANYDAADLMLKYYLSKVCSNKMIKPRILVAMPAGLTAVQQRSVINAVTDAGARNVCLVEAPVAAAVGLNIDFSTPHGTVIVDIGKGTTEIAVLSMGGLAQCDSARVASVEFDDAIIKYIRKDHNILIGPVTARIIKETIGGVVDRPIEIAMKVKGLNLFSGLPEVFEISSSEVCLALKDSMDLIIAAIQQVLGKTPPELVADVAQDGILLMGGGALIYGMEEFLTNALGTKVALIDDPVHIVARGAGKVLKNIGLLKGGDYRFRSLQDLIIE